MALLGDERGNDGRGAIDRDEGPLPVARIRVDVADLPRGERDPVAVPCISLGDEVVDMGPARRRHVQRQRLIREPDLTVRSGQERPVEKQWQDARAWAGDRGRGRRWRWLTADSAGSTATIRMRSLCSRSDFVTP